MRIYKLIGALFAVLAFSAFGIVATASAAETLWTWLPGSVGETIKGKQEGAGKLQIVESATVECKGASILLSLKEGTTEVHSELVKEGSVENKHATLWLLLIHFKECKTLGVAANSLGDESGVILVHAELHNCVINAAKKEFGVLVLPLTVHIEVPSAKLLITVLEKGLFIAKIEQEGTSKLNFLLTATQTAGVQGIEKCEKGEKESLVGSIDEGTEKNAALEAKILLEFDSTIDKTGEAIE